MVKLISITFLILSEITHKSDAWSVKGSQPVSIPSETSRRSFLLNVPTAAGVLSSSILLPQVQKSNAIEEEELIDVYFGCGCFWHVQHEFVEAEQRLLNREGTSITARAGYAGGGRIEATEKDSAPLVCYHNALSIGDYGKQGHGEVVALQIPASKFDDFAGEYFKLFDSKGDRPDQFGDKGLEYRNLVGIPGGASGPYAAKLIEASKQYGDKLDFAKGKGGEKDARAVAYVMDTTVHPFYVAEQYHQFHDGFNFNENYPNSYNSLAATLAQNDKLEKSSCPNGNFGLGIGGL